LSCSNNLKQIGLALHNFHDQNGRLPPGGANDNPPFGTGNATGSTQVWGSSWKVYILPFIEQDNIYKKWQFSNNSGYTNSNNLPLVNNVRIKTYACPSSPYPDFAVGGRTTPRNIQLMSTSYTGIAGSVISTAAGGVYNASNAGQTSDNGILYAGSQVTLVGIVDGTSNTWMVGEDSDHLRNATGQPITSGYNRGYGSSENNYGWTMGHGYPANQTGWKNNQDGRIFNCTAVKYQINQRNVGTSSTTNLRNDAGANFPLKSAHSGGVNILRADGSIRFFSNSTPLADIHAFCTRSGGEVNKDN
jgi:prepilin-type processing-associated H-X9-DG protein